jgi:hypothetical protein
MCLTSIGWLLYSYLVNAFSMSGMESIKQLLKENEYYFLVLGIIVWVASQIFMLATIFRNKMNFHIWKENYQSEWIQVFYPVMLGIYLVLGFIIVTLPGFIVGGISNLFLGEEPSFIIGSIVTILFLAYLVAKTKNL